MSELTYVEGFIHGCLVGLILGIFVACLCDVIERRMPR